MNQLVTVNYNLFHLNWKIFGFPHANGSQRDFASLLPHFYTVVKQEAMEWNNVIPLDWD